MYSLNVMLLAGGLDEVLKGQVYQKLLAYANPIAVLAMVFCGFIWLTSTSTQSAEKAKSWLFRIFIGLVIINGAPKFVEWLTEVIREVGI